MPNENYPWPYYADLQQRIRKFPRVSDYAWGIECALNYLLEAIETNTVPSHPPDLVAALNRTIASASRLHRSRTVALITETSTEQVSDGDNAVEARIELARIERIVNATDKKILLDAGLGYVDREIADRCGSTRGAIRARLARLRFKIAA